MIDNDTFGAWLKKRRRELLWSGGVSALVTSRAVLQVNVNALGLVELVRGHFDAARALFDEALAEARRLDSPYWEAMVRHNLGHLAIPLGQLAEVRSLLAEARRLAADMGGRSIAYQVALRLATVALLEGEPGIAHPYLAECLAYHREQGANTSRFLRLSDVLALYAALTGDPYLALQLIGRAAALRRRPNTPPRFANAQPIHDRVLAVIHEQLSDGEIDRLLDGGRDVAGVVDGAEEELLARLAAGAPIQR